MSQENVEIVRKALALYNLRDFEALQTLNHPDVELDWSASRAVYAGVYRGWPDVFEVHGGRIARIRLYQETREALEAFGLSE